MPPQNSLAPVGLTRAEFNKYYWFSSVQMVTVKNPMKEDFPFMVEMRHYMVKAGEQESFVGPIANVFLNHMAKTLAQRDEQLELMADVTYLAAYYKKLIVEVKDLAPQYDPTNNWQHRMRTEAAEAPPWVKDQPPAPSSQPAVNAASTPPWEQAPLPAVPNMERVSQASLQPVSVNAPTVPSAAEPDKEPGKPKPETREFELNGISFKKVTDDKGETRYFKGEQETDAAAYNKAASMI